MIEFLHWNDPIPLKSSNPVLFMKAHLRVYNHFQIKSLFVPKNLFNFENGRVTKICVWFHPTEHFVPVTDPATVKPNFSLRQSPDCQGNVPVRMKWERLLLQRGALDAIMAVRYCKGDFDLIKDTLLGNLNARLVPWQNTKACSRRVGAVLQHLSFLSRKVQVAVCKLSKQKQTSHFT